jgi:hypothetical protein
MNVYWENVRWETEDTGTMSATLADKEHNSLTLEQRDGMITFLTDGNPSFDVGAIMDITSIFMVLCRKSLSQAGEIDEASGTAASQAEGSVHVPGPRQATYQQDVRSRASW